MNSPTPRMKSPLRFSDDDEQYYDSNDLPVDIEEIKSVPEIDEYSDQNEVHVFHNRRRSSDDDSTRPNSPTYDGKPYANLKQYAGLSTPLLRSADDNSSQKDSVSSLSEMSGGYGENNLQVVDNSVGSGERHIKGETTLHTAQVNSEQQQNENLIFEEIFSSDSLGSSVKVSGTRKNPGPFKDKVQLVQVVTSDANGPIWSLQFSPDGQYLATGGQDARVRIWCIGERPRDDAEAPTIVKSIVNDEKLLSDDQQGIPRENPSLNLFLVEQPYRIFEGHEMDITDLSWSVSNFLLSASMDSTVRLWHVSKHEALQVFQHPDAVTSVVFNPQHDRYFVSACFDRRIRVYDIIPVGQIKDWAAAPHTVSILFFLFP
jgi:WD repeat-containing protein 44